MNPRYAITQATQLQMMCRGGWEYTQGKANKDDKKHFVVSAIQRMNFPLPSHGDHTPKRDNESTILDSMLAGAIIDRVDKQPEPIRSWLWFAYGAWFYTTDQKRLETELLAMYSGESDSKRQKWEHLARMALFDWRQQCWGRDRFKKVLIFSATGIKKQAFYKHWTKHYQQLIARINVWDTHGVSSVAGLLHDYVDRMQQNDVVP